MAEHEIADSSRPGAGDSRPDSEPDSQPDSSRHDSSRPERRRGSPPAHVVVVGTDGQPVAAATVPGDGEELAPDPTSQVEQPAKVMRIGSMIKQLLEEVREAPLDDASRIRLREIHATSIRELEQGLAPELRDELDRLTLPFSTDSAPSDAELRIAQAQLVGWLEGLFHGIQTALFAQQMAARMQLDSMRQPALPGGTDAGAVPMMQPPQQSPAGDGFSTGQYL